MKNEKGNISVATYLPVKEVANSLVSIFAFEPVIIRLAPRLCNLSIKSSQPDRFCISSKKNIFVIRIYFSQQWFNDIIVLYFNQIFIIKIKIGKFSIP